jgi:hydrogenase nickel incorporation protein HypB
MGRFHRHDDATAHEHGHSHGEHDHEHGPDSHEHGAPENERREHETGDHSGYETGPERIEVLERIFGENDRVAAQNRSDLAGGGACAVNIMSSPGAGKTTLLRETLKALSEHLAVGVIEGDIETSLDADRLAGFGAQIELVNTGNGFGGECHLDAPMVRSALVRLDLAKLDLVLVENVGNLVCPAEFDVGERARAMIYSVTEGEDKPLKYPVMFRSCDLVVVNKIDLLPHLDVDMELFERNLRAVNPTVQTIDVSARTGEGVAEWCAWLVDLVGHPVPA